VHPMPKLTPLATQLISEWTEENAPQWAKATVNAYTWRIEATLRDWNGEFITRRMVSQWFEKCIRELPRAVSIGTSAMRSFLRWLYATHPDMVEPDAAGGIPRFRVPKPRRQHIPTAEDVDAAIRSAARPYSALAIALMADLGLREGEVAALRWEDFDERTGFLMIHGKGNRDAELPYSMFPRVVRYLNLVKGKRKRNSGLVYGCTPRAIAQRVECACRRAGITPIPPHSLRRFFAITMATGKGPLKRPLPMIVVQQLMRHTDIRTTMQYLDSLQGPEFLRDSLLEAMGGNQDV
jgi:integrase